MPKRVNTREELRLKIDAFTEAATRKADSHTKSPVPNPDTDALLAIGGELVMTYLGALLDIRDSLATIAERMPLGPGEISPGRTN